MFGIHRPLLGTVLVGALGLLPAVGAQESPAPAGGSPFERAQAAFMSHDLAGAETAYRAVLKQDTLTAHRREAATTLAAIAWRMREDTASAGRVLAEAAGTQWGRFVAPLERSRMLRVWGDYAGARQAAADALAAASTDAERDDAAASWAEATLAPMLRGRLRGAGAASSSLAAVSRDSAALREVVSRLHSVVRRSPGQLEAARLLIDAAALAEDGPALFAGWRSYYLVGTGDTVHSLLAGPRRALLGLAGSPAASGVSSAGRRGWGLARRRAAMRALADSRLFSAAAVVALAPGSGGATLAARDSRARETVVYAAFLDSVGRTTDRYYRATALGKGNPDAWKGSLDSAARRLWPLLVWPGPVARFTQERFAAELDRRFGALINLGETAGYQDLHMGHRVLDERRTVQQYGHTGRVRFVALDAIVSNGFQSWAWDGRAQHGGWGAKELIVQIRPAYAVAPVRAWRDITEPDAVRRRAEELAADSIADLARARETPVAYFPSVPARLARDGRLALLDSLRRAGLSGLDLEAAFEREVGAALVESSIFAHEGRHAIDDGLGGKLTSEDLEYRAKLSEVAFAPRPRLALGGIISPNAGDDTPHGKANLRVLQGLYGWMKEHASEIRGLDRSAPLLPQLPLLTDRELKTAFASLDPFARDSGVSGAAAAPEPRAAGQSPPPAGSPPPERR